MTDAPTRRLDAVLLAGGRASRLDGANKPELEVGGRTLLQHAVAAARAAGADRIVVVGPPSLEAPGCLVVREDPPFGGPVAAIAAGLAALDLPSGPSESLRRSRSEASRRSSGEASRDPDPDSLDTAPGRLLDRRRGPEASDVLVLACDLPNATAAVARLLTHGRSAHRGARGDGACLVDGDGRTQWLTAVYTRTALDRAFAELDRPVDGAAMRHLLAPLELVEVDDGGTVADVDTWPDLERARAAAGAAHDLDPTTLLTSPSEPEPGATPDSTDPSRSTP